MGRKESNQIKQTKNMRRIVRSFAAWDAIDTEILCAGPYSICVYVSEETIQV